MITLLFIVYYYYLEFRYSVLGIGGTIWFCNAGFYAAATRTKPPSLGLSRTADGVLGCLGYLAVAAVLWSTAIYMRRNRKKAKARARAILRRSVGQYADAWERHKDTRYEGGTADAYDRGNVLMTEELQRLCGSLPSTRPRQPFVKVCVDDYISVTFLFFLLFSFIIFLLFSYYSYLAVDIDCPACLSPCSARPVHPVRPHRPIHAWYSTMLGTPPMRAYSLPRPPGHSPARPPARLRQARRAVPLQLGRQHVVSAQMHGTDRHSMILLFNFKTRSWTTLISHTRVSRSRTRRRDMHG